MEIQNAYRSWDNLEKDLKHEMKKTFVAVGNTETTSGIEKLKKERIKKPEVIITSKSRGKGLKNELTSKQKSQKKDQSKVAIKVDSRLIQPTLGLALSDDMKAAFGKIKKNAADIHSD